MNMYCGDKRNTLNIIDGNQSMARLTTASAAPAPAQDGEIAQSTQRQREALTYLEGLISSLVFRLGAVLSGPSMQQDHTLQPVAESILAAELNELTHRINMASVVIDDLISRVQL